MRFWSWLKRQSVESDREIVVSPAIDPAVEASYSTDQPIKSSAEDRFGRAPFAKRIAETIAHRRDFSSLVLGLYGAWGDGKTSVLHMIEERLKVESDVVVVRFNPWHFTSEEQLVRGFFGTLASALGKVLATKGERVGEAIKRYGSLLSLASTSVAGGVVTISPGQAVQGLGEALSATTLDELKERIEKGLSESGKRVVVLIDDIDRLDRAETHAIFKLVKLSAGFDYTTYLLAFDEAIVAAALGERYGEGNHAAGRAFLEKIIQVPLRMPPAEADALRHLAYEGVETALHQAEIELSREEVDLFTIQFMSGLEPKMATPRQARLYSNALMFSLPLVKGEVNIVDFLLAEGLRVFHPRIHSAIRDNPSPWLDQLRRNQEDRSQLVRQIVDDAAPEMSGAERDRLMRGLLRHLFPRASDVQYSGEWEAQWAREKRICSQAYFRRYFTYGVPPNDISDRAIDEFVASLPDLGDASREQILLRLMRAAPAIFVKKMRQREEDFSELQARALIPILCRNGDVTPVERGPFIMGGTRAQAAILIAHLLRIIPSGEDRNRLAAEIVGTALPLSFATECLQWMKPGRDDPEEKHLIIQEVVKSLETSLVARAVEADLQSPLYREFGSDARAFYWLWGKADAEGLSNQLLSNLETGDQEVDAFLGIYVGEAWGMEDGLPRPGDFRREAYDDIARLIDPAEIARLLRNRYGNQLDNPEFHMGEDVVLALRIAHQYMVVHNAVLDERRQAQAGEAEANIDP